MISIITVSFNAVESIEKTIKSVISQKQSDYEYIIIDGGSTDGTVETIRKYSKYISYWCSEPDNGIYDAMNKGIQKAKGNIVNFLNANDVFFDDYVLCKVETYFNDNVGMDVLIGKELIEGKVCDFFLSRTPKSLYIDSFFPHQSTFSKKSVYSSFRGFDTKFRICADYDWILGVYSNGYNIQYVDDIFAVYDTSGTSSSVKGIVEQYQISKKYLLLNSLDDLETYLRDFYLDMYKKVYFRNLIRKSKPDNDIIASVKKCIKASQINIWGVGNIGKALCDFLINCGFVVNHFFVSECMSCHAEYNHIPITEYMKDKVYVVVASELYDYDICKRLNAIGLSEHIDFISYKSLYDMIISDYIQNGGNDYGFNEVLTRSNL